MCQMDIDSNNQSEKITFLNVLIYAVDEHGICHLFETEMLTELQPISVNTEEKMDVSKSIVTLSNQIDNSLQLINEDLIQNSSNFHSVEYLSTQPFSIVDIHENNLSSLHLFNNDISTPILSPPLQLSGHIASQYQNKILINSNNNISKIKKKKKKKLRYPSHRFTVLKKQFQVYLKKRKKKQQQQQQQDQNQLNNISNVIVHHQSQQIESSPNEHSTMIDFQLSPDLSKRKYIYKDINLTNNNQNQINWRIFQCTQQSSCFEQTVTNDRSYHPFDCSNDSISLPYIRIGLSRYHSIKQLHKTIID